ncbi:T9SS type A sorting domain-containing protein [Agriterribacter sp.]|uniref:T9SS type A sorting domain-containing protein n=1 Tax=Agriterribacter sp. TaxID=2821509 RepID=UPI002C97F13F|nr:T9SS type A sorting domain-containing protein [Agriterribacter sp.]HRP56478.1 T9SS type A sorting domain-containing protein [Agriterribacter sp.]
MKSFLFISILCCTSLWAAAQRSCVTTQYWQSQLNNDAALRMRYTQLENSAKTRSAISKKEQGSDVADVPLITIPVVIHVLYNSEEQNISNTQIQSQLNVLNKDFRKLNDDTARIPAFFAPLAADCRIRFELAKSDPEGRATTGIIRKKTDRLYWQQDDKMKFSASGGNDAWDSRYYLNIWVCNLTKSLLGYSTFPGASPEKDGVVIRTDVFGATGNGSSAYNKGRTTTHEVGHWLNLKHLWGDTDCGSDDVEDTPPQKTFNSGCSSFPRIAENGCNPGPGGDMFMNFMDFSDDACLHMFTYGQRQRIHDLFAASGARETILYSTALNEPRNSAALPEEQVNTGAGSHLAIFPNPASATITLRFNNEKLLTPKTYHIYDITGRLVQEGKNENGRVVINALSEGVYFIKLQQGEQVLMAKFIKK